MSRQDRLKTCVITALLLHGLGYGSAQNVAYASWPTYQHDNSRSGATAEKAPRNPRRSWSYQAPSRPISAWDEPAIWDGWSKTHNLKNRQLFDKAFHVAAADGRVYFGSSVDDQIRCIDTETGQILWTFFTEGPIRLAPTIAGSRVYVGSDDGFVYCLDAVTGQLAWKTRVGPSDRQVAGNGRVISPWAVRTGVVVVGDTAYCGAGVIPSEGVYVCALNAATGEARWKSMMNDLPAQGYLLASPTRLYVMTSRDRPLVFDARTGRRLHQVAGGTGGSYALLTGDTLYYGPGKTGELNMIGQDQQDVLASFQGDHMIIAKPNSFIQNGKELYAFDRGRYVRLYSQRLEAAMNRRKIEKQLTKLESDEAAALRTRLDALNAEISEITDRLAECITWRTECPRTFALILTDGMLIGGGDGIIFAVDSQTGDDVWQRDVSGKVYGLAASGGRLFASTSAGEIHCWAQASGVVVDPKGQLASKPLPSQPYLGPISRPKQIPGEFHGPFAEFVAPDKVRVSWDCTEPMSGRLEFGVGSQDDRTWTIPERRMRHEFIVDHVQRERIYGFRVGGTTTDGRDVITETYRFDSHFDYLPVATAVRPSPYADSRIYRSLAAQVLDNTGFRRGYALIVGAVHGKLAYELARQSDLKIIVVEPDAERVRRIRDSLDSAGLYGTRVSVHHRDVDELPYGPFLANLIMSESMLEDGGIPTSLASMYFCLRPAGGTIMLGALSNAHASVFDDWAAPAGLQWSELTIGRGRYWTHQREKLPGTGEWTHQYAGPDNSACSQDGRIRGEMTVQWWGRPGARPMPDRGNRNPAPVSANGRLYVQGNRTLFGLDAYNGFVLWSKQIPTMRRANMPRDASNMIATDDGVLVAMGGRCVTFEGQTGARLSDIPVQPGLPGHDYEWGYVSTSGTTLFGSSVRRGSHYTGDQGEWYESFDTREIARVTSDCLFALDALSGATAWRYSAGVIINSTITRGEERFYFIESRNDVAKQSKSGRLLDEVLSENVLVCLDGRNGRVIWEKPFDFSRCRSMTYMSFGSGTLIVSGSDRSRHFHTYAFDAKTGDILWQRDAPDKKGHHTGHLAHPTIVGRRVYFNKHTYDLRTGDVLDVHDFNWHGCGVMSASSHSVFSRFEYHGMFDLHTKKRTEFLGVRSGCWLSLIPSGGLLLAPETSAGCSCGHSLQTSIAYVPKLLVEEPPW